MKRMAFIVAAVGFLLFLGTAGACDADLVTFGDVITRCTIAGVLMIGGVAAAYIIEQRE